MQGVSTSSHAWFAVAPTRCKEIVASELGGIQVDLTWYESLCAYLNKCFCCCSDSPLTHASISEAVKGIVSVQVAISHIMQEGSGKSLAEDCCLHIFKTARRHAMTLDRIINQQDSEYEIFVGPVEKNQWLPTTGSDQSISIYIKKKGVDQFIFMLNSAFPGNHGGRHFSMVTIPDPTHGEPQKIIRWQTSGNSCEVHDQHDLFNDVDKQALYRRSTVVKLKHS